MKIFVSWSGKPSREVAELLREWIPNVVQQAEMFVSSQDIAKGARGLETIGQNLETTNFGLLVLTPDNSASPWINFEAGALSKSLALGHVIPLLCGIAEVNIPSSPLRQFQHAKIEKEEMLRVVQDINHGCARPLAEEKIAVAFEKWWPDFIAEYEKIELKPAKATKEKDPTVLAETVLEALSSIMSDMNSLRSEMTRQRNFIRRMDRANIYEDSFPLSSLARYKRSQGQGTTDNSSPTREDMSLQEILDDAVKNKQRERDKS